MEAAVSARTSIFTVFDLITLRPPTGRYLWGREIRREHAIPDDGVTMGFAPNEPEGCNEDDRT
jgi:hypothetical protein